MTGNCLKSADLQVHYEGIGQVANLFVNPALEASIRYDRLTGYFTVESLATVAKGLASIVTNGGRMRLVIGLHDVAYDLLLAYSDQYSKASASFDEMKSKLLHDVSLLEDALKTKDLAILAWLINDGFIEVKIAEPVSRHANNIFHVKRMVFTDVHGHVVTATGSPNETYSGLEANYEDITVHFNWETPQYTETHQKNFEDIWQNTREGLRVFDLDANFAGELLKALGSPENPVGKIFNKNDFTFRELLNSSRKSIALQQFALPRSRLYPHQERALLDGMSRWPVRVLLADEVGLGKTLEAGSLVSSMLKYGGISKVLILAPAGLLKQLQEEMLFHFDLGFWIWDSAAKTFIGIDGAKFTGSFDGPLASGGPSLKLVSSQLSRGTKKKTDIFENVAELPDLLVVDEAHSARLNPDSKDNLHPNLFYKALSKVTKRVKHTIFMTATPMQMHPYEFLGLMRLLGLPEFWSDQVNYIDSLRMLATNNLQPTLQSASRLRAMLIACSTQITGRPRNISDNEFALWGEFLSKKDVSVAESALFCRKKFVELAALLVKVHPASQLVIRNTRSGLEALGYKFPERVFESPKISSNQEMDVFFEALETYLDQAYGSVEEAIDPKYHNSLGFVKSAYRQRLVSSLIAAQKSLERRLAKIVDLEEKGKFDNTDIDVEIQDDEELDFLEVSGAELNQRLSHAVMVEKVHLKDILNKLETVPLGVISGDPKFVEAQKFIEQANVSQRMLIFSRYVDTLEGFIKHFEDNSEEPILNAGFAMYTGGPSWIQTSSGRRPAGKRDITRALNEGEISYLFCSDAASEGLNLQAASTLINLDVPWNPARLEQRIGRIARLGQKADYVHIYNYWYPNSIESRMYAKLLERKDLYELAVGEFPQIFSGAISEAVSDSTADETEIINKINSDLQSIRLDAQRIALNSIWNVNVEEVPASKALFKEIEDFLGIVRSTFGVENSNGSSSLNLSDDRLDQVALLSQAKGDSTRSLYEIRTSDAVWGFALEINQDCFKILPSEYIVKIMAAALGIKPLDLSAIENLPQCSVGDLKLDLLATLKWIPDFGSLDYHQIIDNDNLQKFDGSSSPSKLEPNLRLLGKIDVRKES
jgi:superfamily II DNA or RNA helicase